MGPSAHLVGQRMGDFIESHDIIVRVNQTQEIPKHRHVDFGHRTDVLASNFKRAVNECFAAKYELG